MNDVIHIMGIDGQQGGHIKCVGNMGFFVTLGLTLLSFRIENVVVSLSCFCFSKCDIFCNLCKQHDKEYKQQHKQSYMYLCKVVANVRKCIVTSVVVTKGAC
jgi:hypothetical protein